MRAAVVVFLAAALAAASAQATCTTLAYDVYNCALAAYSRSNGDYKHPYWLACCTPLSAFQDACGSLQTQVGAKFFVGDINAQQVLLDAALYCPNANAQTASCVDTTSALLQCALPAALGVSQYFLPFVNVTGGTYTLSFTGIDGSVVTTDPIIYDATVASITAALHAASPQAPFLIPSITKNSSTHAGTYNLTFIVNTGLNAPAFSVNSSGLIGGPAGGISYSGMLLQQAVPASSLSTSSPCCDQAIAMTTNCQGYQFDNASAPNYAFPFPIHFDSYATNYLASYLTTCPSFPAGYCAPTLSATSDCLKSQGYYANPGNFDPGSCCSWSGFANTTCYGYDATAAATIASFNLNTSSSQVLQQELAMCNGGKYPDGVNYMGGNTCSDILPNIFAYTNPDGTVVPITNTCNPYDPSDPNYHYGCNVVTTVKGTPYYKYYPLAKAGAADSYYVNSGCAGL